MLDRKECERLVLEALGQLASVCDGASALDGVGFCGADSGFGRSLAGQTRLSDNQLGAAVKLLQKYRNTQLLGFELPTEADLRRVLLPEDSVAVRYAPAGAAAGKPKLKPIKPTWQDLAAASPYRAGLNQQQAEAFDLAHQWFFAGFDGKWFIQSVDHPFLLTGRPGSGKSFSAQRIAKSLAEIYGTLTGKTLKVALTAPTHRARAVLEKFAGELGLNCHIATMQSLLHLVPGKADHNGKTRLEVNHYSKSPHWAEFGLVIADEQSMTSTDLFAFIPKDIPAILMGDSRQLPPVDDAEDGTGELKLSPVFSLPLGIDLNQVMRFDGQVAHYVDSIADAIDAGAQFPPYPGSFERPDGNLIKIASLETWEESMIDAFRSGEECRALAWTNKRVEALNQTIRLALTGISPDQQPYIEGDRVMAKEPVMVQLTGAGFGVVRSDCAMQTCAEGVIQGVEPDAAQLRGQTISVLWLTIAVDDGTYCRVMTVAPGSFKAVSEVIGTEKKLALQSPDKNSKREHWQAYYALLEQFNLIAKGKLMYRLQYGFASTIHQSQGGTYDYVFSDHQNLMQCRMPAVRNRLIYVASSRASKQLIAYSKY